MKSLIKLRLFLVNVRAPRFFQGIAIMILISLVPLTSFAEEPPAVEWERTFGGSDYDFGRFVQQTSDSGYILVGITYSFGAGGADIWLIKTDAQGKMQWDTTFGGSDYDAVSSVQQTSDGGYIIAGYTYSFGAGDETDILLIKTDSLGKLQWSHTFGGSDDEYAKFVQQTSDGGYIIVGDIYVLRDGKKSDVWLIKTNEQGEMQWDTTFGGSDDEHGSSVQQTSDGGYIIAGTIYSCCVPGGADALLIKINAQCEVEWYRVFGSPYFDYVSFMQQTSDGGYVLTGSVYTHGSGDNEDIWLIKTNAQGEMQWDTTFGGSGPEDDERGHCVRQTSDGGYIIIGYGYFLDHKNDIWLIKTNAQGEMQWDTSFGGSDYDYGYSVQQTSDGGYILLGYTSSFGAGESDIWLIKLEGENQGAVDEEFGLHETFVLSQNYPNPFNRQTNISFDLPKTSHVTLTIFNALGQKVETLINEERTAGTHQIVWNAANFPNGVYLYRLETEDFNTTKKMLLMR